MSESSAGEKTGIGRALRDWVRGLFGRSDPAKLRENIEELLDAKPTETRESEAEAPRPELGAEEREMLGNILDFGELKVDDVKIPRTDIVAVEVGATFEDLMRVFVETRKSRLPVYRETLDDVVGIVHIKDLAPFWAAPRNFALERVLRRVPVVPASMRALALLAEMRKSRQQLAVVVDEYGGIDGLVSIEDLIERIVGKIDDEYDTVGAPLVIEKAGAIEADARAKIEDAEARVGEGLRTEELPPEIDTIGGLVVALAGHVPVSGERIEHPRGPVFEVIDADRRRVKRLRIHGRVAPLET
jgi:CBS domain containing-hemolysin-like protein